VLAVRGRKSGEWRTTPVNPLTLDGERYLVAPRGNTQWVRNMRVAGGGELRAGRRVEKFTATELPLEERPRVLRAYLKKWKFEIGMFFQGVGPDDPDDKLLAIAPDHPVFRIRAGARARAPWACCGCGPRWRPLGPGGEPGAPHRSATEARGTAEAAEAPEANPGTPTLS